MIPIPPGVKFILNIGPFCDMTGATINIGSTEMVNEVGVPLHPFAFKGVTVIVLTTGEEVVFWAIKDAIFPEPLEARPDAVLLFVQE